MGPAELLPIVRQFRDRLVAKVLCEQANSWMMVLSAGGGTEIGEALQLAANAWALKGGALVALEEYIVRGQLLAALLQCGGQGMPLVAPG